MRLEARLRTALDTAGACPWIPLRAVTPFVGLGYNWDHQAWIPLRQAWIPLRHVAGYRWPHHLVRVSSALSKNSGRGVVVSSVAPVGCCSKTQQSKVALTIN